jgi:hypothetical protein
MSATHHFLPHGKHAGMQLPTLLYNRLLRAHEIIWSHCSSILCLLVLAKF